VLKLWQKRERSPAGEASAEAGKLSLLLHVGPHKTGTTSLQKALLRTFGSDRPQKTWYPKPAEFGPGHAAIAWGVLGRKGYSEPRPALGELITEAKRAGAGKLIVSSEEFAASYRLGAAPLIDQTADVDLHIVITLSPIGRRALSLWQERVKHRFQLPLDQAGDVLLNGPGLAANFTQFFVENFPNARLSVLVTNQAAPLDLFAFFTKATGIALNAPDAQGELVANRSLGLIEAEVMRGLNLGFAASNSSDDAYREARKLLRNLFSGREWREGVPMVPLSLPDDWIAPLAGKCAETVRSLRELAAAGKIEIVGELENLNDLPSGTVEAPSPSKAQA
jgi:hypothetical protein